MQRIKDRILRKILELINRYERFRWQISRSIGNKILGILSFLEQESKKGILLRRIQLRLKNKYQTGTTVPGRNFKEIEGIESAFIGAFHYRLYPYLKIILIILTIATIDYLSNCSISTSNAGLYGTIFTFLGTIIFARGLFRGVRGLQRGASSFNHTGNYGILRNIPNRVDWNELVSLGYSSADAVWATIFVSIGFAFNVISLYPIASPIPC